MDLFLVQLAQSLTKDDAENAGIPTMDADALLSGGLNLVYFLAGVIAVIVIIAAGIMYTTSAGDAGRIAKAKNLLTYSIVGLVVVLSAFAITNFVIGSFN